jgi:hypothetical protein
MNQDPLCGNSLNVSWFMSASVSDMAGHQGNIAMRELLSHPHIHEKVKLGRSSNNNKSTLPLFHEPSVKKSKSKKAKLLVPEEHPYYYWEYWRDSLQEGGDVNTKEGQFNLELLIQAIKGHRLGNMIFGVLEKWDESMKLFDCLAPLPTGVPWYTAALKGKEIHGSDLYKQEEKAELSLSLHDDRLQEVIGGDIALYNQILIEFDNVLASIKQNKQPCWR